MQEWVDRESSAADFRGANLAESPHTGSAFRNCILQRTSLWHSTFAQCSVPGSVFVQCRMRPVTFDEVDFTLAVLRGNDLRTAAPAGARRRRPGRGLRAGARAAPGRGPGLAVQRFSRMRHRTITA
ncbi:hypothetical protein AWC19_13165 [Mycobacterium palustre]|uniref:Pentapeptide repeat-containing protein n=1 Tax=Mycobacterium palustre TaxID=153971 RepID=A0A1X1ZHA0_9MYCO|nr:hypothetical protein AWC19_13165 [Mycobacterium palustre]